MRVWRINVAIPWSGCKPNDLGWNPGLGGQKLDYGTIIYSVEKFLNGLQQRKRANNIIEDITPQFFIKPQASFTTHQLSLN